LSIPARRGSEIFQLRPTEAGLSPPNVSTTSAHAPLVREKVRLFSTTPITVTPTVYRRSVSHHRAHTRDTHEWLRPRSLRPAPPPKRPAECEEDSPHYIASPSASHLADIQAPSWAYRRPRRATVFHPPYPRHAVPPRGAQHPTGTGVSHPAARRIPRREHHCDIFVFKTGFNVCIISNISRALLRDAGTKARNPPLRSRTSLRPHTRSDALLTPVAEA